MEVIKTNIEGVLIIEPKVFGDKRGYFFESFSQREFDEKVAPILGHTIENMNVFVLNINMIKEIFKHKIKILKLYKY